MVKELFKRKLGEMAEMGIVLEKGVLTPSLKAEFGFVKLALELHVDLLAGAKALKAKIPGSIDDALIDLVTTALLGEVAKSSEPAQA